MGSPQFVPLSLAEFERLVARYDFRPRRIDSVHMHHTWRPTKQEFRGLASLQSIWRFHTETNGWSDIAQHVTIDPDGIIWTGRSWRQAPASCSGHNGTSRVGPFMLEVVGNFDKGRETLVAPQLDSVVGVIAAMQRANDLSPDSLRFHRDLGSPKSCPGSSLDRDEILKQVQARHSQSVGDSSAGSSPSKRAGGGARPRSLSTSDPQSSDAVIDEGRIAEALSILSVATPSHESPELGMELVEEEPAQRARAANYGGMVERGATSRGADDGLDAETLTRLRPYVVNLVQGRFSSSGKFQTAEEDVDAIVHEHLAPALERATRDRPLRIALWAHGGLVSEEDALKKAAELIPWWRANDVYPIHFVWETGLGESIKQLISSAFSRSRAPLDMPRDFADHFSDPLIERLTSVPGRALWSGMKRSAERASDRHGGARYVADKIASLIKGQEERVRLHAIGHSAGSIFHSHLVPLFTEQGVQLRSLQLLAPAVRVDTFWEQLRGIVDDPAKVKEFAMYTMAVHFEKADDCMRVYRKSLLYLVSLAFEPEGKTPLLGLEEFIRKDDLTAEFLGLGGGKGPGQVVWSKSIATSGRNASRSTKHGCFDEDSATMNSVIRRIRELDDVQPIVAYAEPSRGRRCDDDDFTPDGGDSAPTTTSSVRRRPPPARPSMAGARRALCIGIDDYTEAPLGGCVADANRWAEVLRAQGFEVVDVLTNARATRCGILDSIERLLVASRPGDVVVLQYSGHGTSLPDADDDENDGLDEALVPHDYETDYFIVDDDLKAVFGSLADGVNLTCFFDCCYSGTITRLAVNRRRGAMAARSRVRARYLKVSEQVRQAYLAQRRNAGAPPAKRSARGRLDSILMQEVVFSACRSNERAYESDGQGDFTRIATALLEEGAAGVSSHQQFIDRVRHAFGTGARQEPQLDCGEPLLDHVLFSSFSSGE